MNLSDELNVIFVFFYFFLLKIQQELHENFHNKNYNDMEQLNFV